MAGRPVVIIGEMYDPSLSVGYPLPPPLGIWGGPPLHPAHPIAPGGPPLGIWGGAPLPVPTPPIYYPPAQPPGIWGGAPLPVPTPPIHYPPAQPPGVVTPPIYYPPSIWGPTDPRPTHPIAPGGPPPGIWGGGGVPMPTPPIYLPPGFIPGLKPEHPIYLPPSIWGPTDPRPSHPIVLPPPGSEEKPEVLENWDVKTYWSPATGWGVAIVPSESHPGTPTPSK